jgi:hypothetical protein
MAKIDWDQSQDKASAGFEVLPKGRYPCRIVNSTKKDTSRNTGYFLEFEFEVVKGDYSNRKLWARLNVKNDSEVAQRIGREQFKALCEAAGKPTVKDTSELHGKFVVCIVDIERGREGQNDQNRVNGFLSPEAFREAGGSTPSKPAAAAKPASKSEAVKAAAGADIDPDDDIPF